MLMYVDCSGINKPVQFPRFDLPIFSTRRVKLFMLFCALEQVEENPEVCSAGELSAQSVRAMDNTLETRG